MNNHVKCVKFKPKTAFKLCVPVDTLEISDSCHCINVYSKFMFMLIIRVDF